ncbi:NB-ARC domains-containing protein [Tanacetum coccineum]
MAELVLSALLPIVFEKLTSILKNKIARSNGIHSELKKWERSLSLIQELLEDASQKEVASKSIGVIVVGCSRSEVVNHSEEVVNRSEEVVVDWELVDIVKRTLEFGARGVE